MTICLLSNANYRNAKHMKHNWYALLLEIKINSSIKNSTFHGKRLNFLSKLVSIKDVKAKAYNILFYHFRAIGVLVRSTQQPNQIIYVTYCAANVLLLGLRFFLWYKNNNFWCGILKKLAQPFHFDCLSAFCVRIFLLCFISSHHILYFVRFAMWNERWGF